MADWRTIGWWELPGPSRFIELVVGAVTGSDDGVLGLLIPSKRPPGLLEAIGERIERSTEATVTMVDASGGLRGRSPITMMSVQAGVRTSGLRSTTEFLDLPELSGRVFVVDGIPGEEWYPWAYALKAMRSERARRERVLAPSVVLALPPGVSPDDAKAALGRYIRWSGYVSRHDTQTWVERLFGWPDDSMLSRTAVSVTVELSGWDPAMVRALAQLKPEAQADPRNELARLPDLLGDAHPCWDNGMVDSWDGIAWVHTAALISAKLHEELMARLWRGQVRILFPFLDQVRNAFISKYLDRLRSLLPIEKDYHGTVFKYSDPWRLELFDINDLLKADLTQRELALMYDCIIMRRSMAHYKPTEGWRIKRISEQWDEISAAFPDSCPGWDWPRCGQKLVVMVGPSGGGKTTWAERNHDRADIVSSDAIREEIFGTHDNGGNLEPVFEQVRAEVTARLSAGRSAVIDAINIDSRYRVANVKNVPEDVRVEYVIVDRPMAEKLATSRWRAEKPGILETHAAQFASALPDILAGDGLRGVRVVDLRKEVHSDRLVPTV